MRAKLIAYEVNKMFGSGDDGEIESGGFTGIDAETQVW